MEYESRRKLLLIINPRAGKMQAPRRLSAIVEVLCRGGFAVSVHITARRGEATELVTAIGRDFDRIVCAGGDGTLNEVVNGLQAAGLKTEVGYIPCGSTNDLAASLGLPKKLLAAAETVVDGAARPLDVGLFCGERCFTYVASFGAFTKASYATSQASKNLFGHLAYVFAGLGSLQEIRPIRVQFESGQRSGEGEYLFGSVTNSTSVGGVMKLAPSAVDLQDGLFEVLLIKKPIKANDLGKILHEVLSQNYDDELVTLFHTERIRFVLPEPVAWTVDGEAGGLHGEVTAENLHGAMNLILPRDLK